MNQQEQATKSAAIFQDTINGTNDPTPWPVTMWASSGDTIWTAGTARTAGEDSVGMIYGPGDTIVHRNTIAGDTTRATESFAIRPADGQSPMDAMLAGIEQWNHRHPDRWDTVAEPGRYRMTDPTTGRPLPMGWSDSLAVAASAAGRLDPDLLQASLMQNAVEHEPRPCVFFLEDNGYDLMVFSWHRNQQGLFDAMTFKHLQYDDLSMQITTISHSEDMRESFPAKSMSDGELLTQSRVYRDEYQHWREQDGGSVAQGMTGRVMRSGLLKPGLEQKPLLNLNDGRRAPDWDEFTDQAAISILQGRPVSPTPALPQQEQPAQSADPATETQTPAWTAAMAKQVWPNAWVANRLAHTYILRAKDGRDWPKMIVGLPRGTVIDGQDLTGWATDMFMSGKNQRQKNEGRAVNLRFKPDTPVELFTGRGTERRTMQVQAGRRNEMGAPTRRPDRRNGRRTVDQPPTPPGRRTAHPGTRRHTGTDAGQRQNGEPANRRTGRGGDGHATENGADHVDGTGTGPRRSRLAGPGRRHGDESRITGDDAARQTGTTAHGPEVNA